MGADGSSVEMRTCSKCGVEKPYIVTEFRLGHRQCLECLREKDRARHITRMKLSGGLSRVSPEKVQCNSCGRFRKRDKFRRGRVCVMCEVAIVARKGSVAQQPSVAKGNESNLRRMVERRVQLNQIKDVPCMDCGLCFPAYAMDFDHRDPKLKMFTIGREALGVPWRVLKAELAKCDVLCACCHRLRTWRLTNPKGLPAKSKARRLARSIKETKPCLACGGVFHFSQMDFDHVRGVKIGNVNTLPESKVLAEAEKCELVCANCHRIRTAQRMGKRRTPLSMTWQRHRQNEALLSPTPEWQTLAGTMSDRDLARKCIISFQSVSAYRRRFGIPRYKGSAKRKSRPWHNLVGTMPDRAVAKQSGIHFATVHAYRKKLGIHKFSKPKLSKWACTNCGVEKHHMEFGHGHRQCRQCLKIKKKLSLTIPAPRPWHAYSGKEPDRVVADRFRVTVSSVNSYRKRMGIPLFADLPISQPI